MGSEWKTARLGDLISVKHGYAFKGDDFSERHLEGPIVVTIGNFDYTGGFRFESTRLKRCISEYPKDYEMRPGEVLLAMTCQTSGGEILGIPGVVPNDGETYLHNQRLGKVVLESSQADMGFLYWLFLSHGFNHHLCSTATGTKILHTAPKRIESYEFSLPPLPEQKAIAHILGSLDNKIELNRRMNATLEGMAQALFKSWFVDFDPVIDNAIKAGNPIPDELAPRAEVRRQALANGTANREAAKIFPSAFQFTEELGWIPEGWHVGTFDMLARLDTTSIKPFEQPDTVWEHYSIPSYDSTGMPISERGDEIKSNKYLVKPGAILSSKLNPNTERTWWPLIIDKEASICSTEFMQFVPNNRGEQAFVYSLIRSEPFQAKILERVTGSTGSRQRAQPKQIAKIEVLDCGKNLREEFAKLARPLFQSIQNNSLRIQTLTKLRDTLLPILISGELQVPEVENPARKIVA